MFVNTEGWPVDHYIVKSVEVDGDGGMSVTSTDGWTLGITADEANAVGTVPYEGQVIHLYGGFGYQVRGIVIGGVVYRYMTRAQAEEERQAWLAEYEAKRQRAYDENIIEWERRTSDLSDPFYERILRFEQKYGAEKFWREDGGYELFVCEQADKLYKLASSQPDPVAWLDSFYAASYDEQKKMFPELDEGHSGNTFGGMVGLAKAVARGENI